MKRIVSLALSLLLIIDFFPLYSSAAPSGANLQQLLDENEWEKKDLEEFLWIHFGEDLAEITTMEELQKILGEPITAENLAVLATDYGFKDVNELVDILKEYGEIEKDAGISDVIKEFRYINALDETLSYYVVTETPITSESLQELLEELELSEAELNEILAVFNKQISDFKTIEELEGAFFLALLIEEMAPDLEEFGLYETEIYNLINHLDQLNLSDPALGMEAKMLEMEERLAGFEDFDSASDLTEEQLNELVSVFEEMLAIFQLNAKYYLVDGNNKTQISTSELMKLEDTNGRDLLIEFYNMENELLADIIITADMFDSELIEDVVAPIKVVKDTGKIKTVKGGKLPNTAGNYAEGALLGFGLLLAGVFMFRRRNTNNA